VGKSPGQNPKEQKNRKKGNLFLIAPKKIFEKVLGGKGGFFFFPPLFFPKKINFKKTQKFQNNFGFFAPLLFFSKQVTNEKKKGKTLFFPRSPFFFFFFFPFGKLFPLFWVCG